VTPAIVLHSGAAADSQMRVVGSMPFGFALPPGSAEVLPPIWIDSQLQRGVVETSNGGFQIYDTSRLQPLSFIKAADAGGATDNAQLGIGILAAVDEDGHRVFFPANPGPPGCSSAQSIHVLDLVNITWSSAPVPCYQNGIDGFVVDSISYYAPTKKLYVVGESIAEFNEATTLNSFHESTIVRELDPNSSPPFAVDWEVDASSVCDFHMGSPSDHTGVVARVGDKVLVYCYRGKKYGQGEIAMIPLHDNRPTGNVTALPVVSAGPGGTVTADPQTGRVLITALSPPYGPATWVADTVGQRFAGVVPLGVPGQFLSGFDPSTGRLYFHDRRGFVVTDTRQDPLSGGVSYDILHGAIASKAYRAPFLSADASSRRIFVPDYDHQKFDVVQDDAPVFPACQPGQDPTAACNPDAGTADIAEQPGKTDRAFSSASNAFGVHLLNTSGPVGAIQNTADPAGVMAEGVVDCYLTPSNCISTTLLSPGDREGFLAQTSLAQGSALGSVAFASAGRVSPKDHATDGDIRELGNCNADRVGAVAGSDQMRKAIQDQCNTPAPIKDAVDQSPFAPATPENLKKGTQRKDGSEYPINGSLCVDFGGHPVTQNSTDPSVVQGYSTVSCDATTQATTASSELAAGGLPGIPNPTVSIAHASSQTTSQLTDHGLVTTASATATGINIGGQFSIGRVYTQAITQAHGRSGTTQAGFTRVISDAHGPGLDCAATCDPQQVVNAINQQFSGHLAVVMAPPEKLATPHGYSAVVAKDPGQRSVDQLLNDDDTVTFDGLDVVLIDDNSYGSLDRVTFDSAGNPQFQPGAPAGGNRSRFVVGLAGIQAESHYGVFPLVEGGGGGGGGTSAVTGSLGTPNEAGTPGSEYVIPPNIARGEGIIGVPGYRLASSPGTPAQVKHHPGLVSRLLHGLLRPFQEALKKFWALIINHPVEAVLVFLILSLLAIPLYLGYRRRQLARALAV
jgi:hypothetical protein